MNFRCSHNNWRRICLLNACLLFGLCADPSLTSASGSPSTLATNQTDSAVRQKAAALPTISLQHSSDIEQPNESSLQLGNPDGINHSTSSTSKGPIADVFTERRDLFDKVNALTGIAWFYLAAIDQYERTLTIALPKKRPSKEGLTAIHFDELEWSGLLNPNQQDRNPVSIAVFNGVGKDGSGDGIADPNNDIDVLYSMASIVLKHGYSPEDFRISLWQYYQNGRSVERIEQFAKIYAKYDTLELNKHAFPLPLGSNYSVKSNWGANRSWGGARMHEGSDIFAGYGVPVRSTCYGVIETMGWNRYGGWRVGIRGINNVYHYYAHLSGFNKKVKQGDIVEPGEIVGWVGSSGYGKPGTQGKFPPHLHFGMYRDFGLFEWAFDPFPSLRKWEREERSRRK